MLNSFDNDVPHYLLFLSQIQLVILYNSFIACLHFLHYALFYLSERMRLEIGIGGHFI